MSLRPQRHGNVSRAVLCVLPQSLFLSWAESGVPSRTYLCPGVGQTVIDARPVRVVIGIVPGIQYTWQKD